MDLSLRSRRPRPQLARSRPVLAVRMRRVAEVMDLDALREAVEVLEGSNYGDAISHEFIEPVVAAARAVLDSEEVWWCRNPRPEKCINEASRAIGVEISERDPGLGVDHSECGPVLLVRRRLLAEEGT